MPQRLAIFALWLLPNLSSSVPPARVEDVRFPADAGVVDVTEAPYNATGDGKTDATAALQKALTDHPSGNRIIYLPNGTYLVSDTLRWPMGKPGGGDDCKRVILQGQSRLGTVIKLKDNCPGFAKPLADPRYKRPTGKGVIWTGKAPAQRFRNGVRNLTIDTGRGNAGACGLQFIANNSGCVRHVLIRSGDGRGVNGLNLPVKATPEVPWDPPGQWVSPLQFGGKPGDKVDDTAAIQRAIDSGKTTVYLPNGRWVVRGDLLLRGKVRRFIGCEGTLKGEGVIRIVDGASPVVVFERIEIQYAPIGIRHESRRTLVISSCRLGRNDNMCYEGRGGGDLFLEDVCSAPWVFRGQNVWARQINPESKKETKITAARSKVWLLGLKTESDAAAVEATGGAVEVCGAFIYANTGTPKGPLFVLHDTAFSATMGEYVIRKQPFRQLVVETRGDETRTLKIGVPPRRGGGSKWSLFAGRAKQPSAGPDD